MSFAATASGEGGRAAIVLHLPVGAAGSG